MKTVKKFKPLKQRRLKNTPYNQLSPEEKYRIYENKMEEYKKMEKSIINNRLIEIPDNPLEPKQHVTKNEYSEQLKDERWRTLRLEVLKRDKYECQLCMSKTTNLCVHHKKYVNNKKAWEYPLNYLITLCDKCHNKIHGKKQHRKKKNK